MRLYGLLNMFGLLYIIPIFFGFFGFFGNFGLGMVRIREGYLLFHLMYHTYGLDHHMYGLDYHVAYCAMRVPLSDTYSLPHYTAYPIINKLTALYSLTNHIWHPCTLHPAPCALHIFSYYIIFIHPESCIDKLLLNALV